MRIGVETIVFDLRVLDMLLAKWHTDLRMVEASAYSYELWKLKLALDVAQLYAMQRCVARLIATEVLQYVVAGFVFSATIFNFFVAGMAFHRLYVDGPSIGWIWPGTGLAWCFAAVWVSRSWWEVWRGKLMGD